MSKSLKTVVSIAAAIAIPFAAPMIASSAALAGISSTIGMTATSALAGAALGAAKGAIFNEDIGRSALMGGIGGGISGYAQAPTTSVGTGAYDAGIGLDVMAGPSAAPAATTTGLAGGFGSSQAEMLAAQEAGFGATQQAQMLAAQDAGFGSIGADTAYAYQSPAAGLNMSQSQMLAAQEAGFGAPAGGPGAYDAGIGLDVMASSGAPTAAAPKTFLDAVKEIPGEVAAKFKDPKKLADLTLRAAGQLAGSVLAGDGLTAEEQELLNAQTEELRQLQATNEGLFREKLSEAQRLMGESKYFDPEYFGLQRARQTQLRGARAKTAGLRGLTGQSRAAESRRFDLATGRDTGTAYDVGFQSAIAPRIQTQTAGLSAMPGYLNYTTPAIDAQLAGAKYASLQRDKRADEIGDMFGSLTGRSA